MIRSQRVDEYISKLDESKQKIANTIREIIAENAPDASEDMRYGMPGYHLDGPLIYFGLFEKHVGLYPTPSGVTSFESELAQYKHAKGSIQFGLSDVPLDLIARIVKYRVEENKIKQLKK